MKKKSSSYICVHSPEEDKKHSNAVVTPVFNTTNYLFTDLQELKRYVGGDHSLYLYSRYTNPTVEDIEHKLAALEKAEDCVVLSSGMGAAATALLNLVRAGDHLVSTPILYGGVFSLMTIIMKNAGLQYDFAQSAKPEDIRKALKPNTKVIYAETPTNPNLTVVDLSELAQIARDSGCLLVVDSTFGTPINQNPIELGANIIIHSGTKYLSGHSDLVCGAIIGPEKYCREFREYRKFLGTNLDPQAAFLFARGLKTLELRVARHNANGLQVARFLETHPKVTKVRYPGLESSPTYEIARKQMRGFGGVVCFEIEGGLEKVGQVIERMQLFMHATSLGSVESLVSIPILTSHIHYAPEELQRVDVNEGMIRLSCGIEEAEEMIADLNQALSIL